MSPPIRQVVSYQDAIKMGARESAVLILLYEKNNKIHLVLIERSVYDGKHSGQISFPGGKKDVSDKNLKETALRETFEEIGLNATDISIIAQLSHLYIPVSNFLVFPFVGFYNKIPKFIKDDFEVENIIEVSLETLLDKNNISEKTIKIPNKNIQFKTPIYKINNIDIWGATAMILSEFLEIIEKKKV